MKKCITRLHVYGVIWGVFRECQYVPSTHVYIVTLLFFSYWYKQYKATYTDVFNFSDAMFAGKLTVPKCWLFVAFNPLSALIFIYIIIITYCTYYIHVQYYSTYIYVYVMYICVINYKKHYSVFVPSKKILLFFKLHFFMRWWCLFLCLFC